MPLPPFRISAPRCAPCFFRMAACSQIAIFPCKNVNSPSARDAFLSAPTRAIARKNRTAVRKRLESPRKPQEIPRVGYPSPNPQRLRLEAPTRGEHTPPKPRNYIRAGHRGFQGRFGRGTLGFSLRLRCTLRRSHRRSAEPVKRGFRGSAVFPFHGPGLSLFAGM